MRRLKDGLSVDADTKTLCRACPVYVSKQMWCPIRASVVAPLHPACKWGLVKIHAAKTAQRRKG